MSLNFNTLAVATVLMAAFAAPALAQSPDENFALGAGVGTDGAEVLGEFQLSPQWVVRGQGSFLDLDHDFNSSDVKYHGHLRSNVGGAFLDWHPGSNPFFVSAGVDAGARRVNVTANPSAAATITINGTTYTSSQIGSVYGDVAYANVSPVATLGWDTTFHSRSPIGFRVQAGVLFAGDPSVHLNATGPFADDPTVQANLRQEEASLKHDARDFRFYPIVSADLTYRF